MPSSPLRRFWFPIAGRLGIGVTASNLDHALELARAEAEARGWLLVESAVVHDVDLSTLDQRHLIPNMGDVTRVGVWFPL